MRFDNLETNLSASLSRSLGLLLVTWAGLASGQRVLELSVTPVAAAESKLASISVEIAGQNYLLIKAGVNGSDPLTFVLDSGGGSGLVLSFQAAQALHAELEGTGKGGGAGAASFATTSLKGASLALPGGAVMRNQTFAVYPADKKLLAGGQAVDGIIGYSLFDQYVVEIDYQSRVVTLYDPRSYQYSGPGESIPIQILSRLPFVRATLAVPGGTSLEGRFIVDSGAGRFAVIVNTVVVEKNHLLQAAQTTIKDAGAEGVGGEVTLLVGRLPSVRVGSFAMSSPVVHFAQDRMGAFGSSEFSGVIGGELLRRFKVILDYSRKRMILESYPGVDDAFEYDMSGMRLSTAGGYSKRIRVSGIIENSPATDAGVRVGDLISAIDAVPAADLSLFQISGMFKQEGKQYLLDIVRGEEKKQLKLKLRRLI